MGINIQSFCMKYGSLNFFLFLFEVLGIKSMRLAYVRRALQCWVTSPTTHWTINIFLTIWFFTNFKIVKISGARWRLPKDQSSTERAEHVGLKKDAFHLYLLMGNLNTFISRKQSNDWVIRHFLRVTTSGIRHKINEWKPTYYWPKVKLCGLMRNASKMSLEKNRIFLMIFQISNVMRENIEVKSKTHRSRQVCTLKVRGPHAELAHRQISNLTGESLPPLRVALSLHAGQQLCRITLTLCR